MSVRCSLQIWTWLIVSYILNDSSVWLNQKELLQWWLELPHLSLIALFLRLKKLLVPLPCNQTTFICHLVSQVAVFFMPRMHSVSFGRRKEILFFFYIFSASLSLKEWVGYSLVLTEWDDIMPELLFLVLPSDWIISSVSVKLDNILSFFYSNMIQTGK